MRLALLALIFLPIVASARSFDVRRDTLSFGNETAWRYQVDEHGKLHISSRDTAPVYAHSCFLMSRAVMQFWQFARFEPKQPRATREEYTKLIRRLTSIPVWSSRKERIVVPGFRDLREFSGAMPQVFQENLGNWLLSYFRVGNYRMAMGHPRFGQAFAARWLEKSMQEEGKLRGVYISRFPSMNHCLVVYRMEKRANGDRRFWVYDPNYPGEETWLDFRAATRSFEFEPRWYFPGGRVNLMRVYISPFH
jgi:hypothetical protein